MDAKNVFLKHLAPTSHDPLLLDIVSAEGVWLTDVNGKRYMDLIAGVGVASVGHRNPKVVAAIKDQLDKHSHVMVYGEYIQTPVNDLAKSLSEVLPDNLQTSYFVNSGAEANEAAIKLAKRITGRTEIVSFHRSYHGNTQGALSVSGNEYKKQAFRPLIPDIRFIEYNNPKELDLITARTAAVIIEPIQGDAGVIIPSQAFMEALRQQCTETGAQLIFDEVQSGMGRTGKLFALEHFNIVPDILTLAKGLGGGLPIGAFISSFENMQLLAENPMLGHITTFGGNPVCCASADATLKIIRSQGFLEEVEAKGVLFESLLVHPKIEAVRRIGFMMAVDLESEQQVYDLVKAGLEKGVIIYFFLSTRNSFRVSPPLTITIEEIHEAVKLLNEALDTLEH
jgi:acetylornithine/N-succinyldiaminopimelate aminotransferase